MQQQFDQNTKRESRFQCLMNTVCKHRIKCSSSASLSSILTSDCYCNYVHCANALFVVVPLEHGQKFPGLRPADAAGLDGPQQKWAETGPGGPCTEASADRIQPGASEERQAALRVALPQNIWLACGAASRWGTCWLLIPQLLPHCHHSGRRLPQRHFQTGRHTCSRGQAGATALLPNIGDTVVTNRAKWVYIA